MLILKHLNHIFHHNFDNQQNLKFEMLLIKRLLLLAKIPTKLNKIKKF
jgi:hypothetical protein